MKELVEQVAPVLVAVHTVHLLFTSAKVAAQVAMTVAEVHVAALVPHEVQVVVATPAFVMKYPASQADPIPGAN